MSKAFAILECFGVELGIDQVTKTADSFSSLDEAVRLANGTEYGLSLGILTRDVMKGLALAERIPSGLVHINDQTVNDEALVPFGGVGESGTGSRHGGAEANLDAFTDVQWVTMRGDLPQYPF